MEEPKKRECDNCKYYEWFYDRCNLFQCEMDDRAVCSMWCKRNSAEESEE